MCIDELKQEGCSILYGSCDRESVHICQTSYLCELSKIPRDDDRNCNCNCNCKYDDLYSTVSSKLLLGCFTRLLNIKARGKI